MKVKTQSGNSDGRKNHEMGEKKLGINLLCIIPHFFGLPTLYHASNNSATVCNGQLVTRYLIALQNVTTFNNCDI